MRVAFALPLIPRGEGMAERRPRFPFGELRWLHGRWRTIPSTSPASTLLRNAQHAHVSTCAGGEAPWRHPISEWRPVLACAHRAPQCEGAVQRRSHRAGIRRSGRSTSLHGSGEPGAVGRGVKGTRNARTLPRVAHGSTGLRDKGARTSPPYAAILFQPMLTSWNAIIDSKVQLTRRASGGIGSAFRQSYLQRT